MKIEEVPVGDLRPADYNPRQISPEQLALLEQGLAEFGMVQPVVANKRNGVVVGGHQRLEAARSLGWECAPVVYVDLDDKQERQLNLALNKIGGDWDVGLLGAMLAEMDDGDRSGLTGFDEVEVSELLATLDVENLAPQKDPDSVPDVVSSVVSAPGELFLLGRHRVICGDSRNLDLVDRVLGGPAEQADMCFTDPPYFMNYKGAVGAGGKINQRHASIENDDLTGEDAEEFLGMMCDTLAVRVKGAWYICFYRLGIDQLLNAINSAGMRWRNLIIWKKEHFTLSQTDYKSIYEPIVYGFGEDYTPIAYGWSEEHEFFGPKGEKDVWDDIPLPGVWEINRTKKNDLHPTMKPVALCERAIKNSSRAGQTVLDMFAGSGSTMIACENLGRSGRMMEKMPQYLDVIIRRWQDYTGKKAQREDGVLFDEIEPRQLLDGE